MRGEETAAGGRVHSRCAWGLKLPFLARVSLLLRSSTAGCAPPVRVAPPSLGATCSRAAACARQLPPWPGTGNFFTTGGCGRGGDGEARAGLGINGRSVVLAIRLHRTCGMHAGGLSEDMLQRVLPLVLGRLEPEGAVQLFQVRKPPPSLPPILDAPLPSLPC